MSERNEIYMELFEGDFVPEEADRGRVETFLDKFLETHPQVRVDWYGDIVRQELLDQPQEDVVEALVDWICNGGNVFGSLGVSRQVQYVLETETRFFDPDLKDEDEFRQFLSGLPY